MADLNITCASGDNTQLDLWGHTTDDNWITLKATSPEFQSLMINLDEERARELFNWLGGWLHGGHRYDPSS